MHLFQRRADIATAFSVHQVVQVVRSRYQNDSRRASSCEKVSPNSGSLFASNSFPTFSFPPLPSVSFSISQMLGRLHRIIPPSIAGLPPFRRVLIHRSPDCRPFPLHPPRWKLGLTLSDEKLVEYTRIPSSFHLLREHGVLAFQLAISFPSFSLFLSRNRDF